MSNQEQLSELMLLLVRVTVDLSERFKLALGTSGVSNRDVLILITLRTAPGLTPSELAEALHCSRSMMSQLLRRHIDRGWVRRVADPSDHRSARLELKLAGIRAVAELDKAFKAWVAETRTELVSVVREVPLAGCAEVREEATLRALRMLGEAGSGYTDEVTAAVAAAGLGDPTQRRALSVLVAREGLRPSELGQGLGLSSSGVSSLLRRMEASDLVVCSRQRLTDGRAVWVVPTSKGAALGRETLEVLGRHETDLRRALGSVLSAAGEPVVATA